MQVHERVRDAEKVSVIQGGRGRGEGSFLIKREGYAGVKRQLWGEKKRMQYKGRGSREIL